MMKCNAEICPPDGAASTSLCRVRSVSGAGASTLNDEELDMDERLLLQSDGGGERLGD